MIFAIGDIHGRADMLDAALAELQLNLNPADTVVFLGDYIDRGDDSRGVIEAVLAFQALHEKTICLRGNHEQMLLDAYEGDEYALWIRNGGKETLKSYHGGTLPTMGEWRECIPESHRQFLNATALQWEAARFFFVHAGLVPPSQRAEWQALRSAYLVPAEPRLWIREDFIESAEDFGKIVVFGHTVQKSYLPLIMANKMGLDTGAVFGGRLTVGIFDDDTTQYWFFQVDQSLKVLGLEAYSEAKPEAPELVDSEPADTDAAVTDHTKLRVWKLVAWADRTTLEAIAHFERMLPWQESSALPHCSDPEEH